MKFTYQRPDISDLNDWLNSTNHNHFYYYRQNNDFITNGFDPHLSHCFTEWLKLNQINQKDYVISECYSIYTKRIEKCIQHIATKAICFELNCIDIN